MNRHTSVGKSLGGGITQVGALSAPRLGRWRGFWVQGTLRCRTELDLIVEAGQIKGDGADWLGEFTIRGSYAADGAVEWTKSYRNQHEIRFAGYAEAGNGIWGTWEIEGFDKGGFHIWPDEFEMPHSPAKAAIAKLPPIIRNIEQFQSHDDGMMAS